VHHGVLEAVLFLSSLPDVDFACRSSGQNLLHLAAQAPANRTEIIENLLSKRVDPLEVSKDGRTILHHLLANPTFKEKDFELLEKFRGEGCTLDATDLQGNSLLHVLLDENLNHGFYQNEDDPDEGWDQDHVFKLASYLVEHHDTRSLARKDGLLPMQIALRRRLPTRFIELAIPGDPSVWNCSGSAQYSPLHEAVEPGGHYSRYFDEDASLRMLNILIDRDGLDVSVVDSRGQTPCLLLCDKCYKGAPPSRARMIKRLLETGSDVNAKGENEWTAANCLVSNIRGVTSFLY
jgi:ankyrin repeat protein